MRKFRSVNQPGRRVLVRTTEADTVSGTKDLMVIQDLCSTYIKHSINAAQLDHPEDEQAKGSPHPISPVENSSQTLPQWQPGLIPASCGQDVLFHLCSRQVQAL